MRPVAWNRGGRVTGEVHLPWTRSSDRDGEEHDPLHSGI